MEHPYKIGENYFIRTVTHHHVGRLKAVYELELVLEKASWIPDDGVFHKAIQNGEVKEVEPFSHDEDVIIGRGALIDAQIIKWPLPTKQK